MEMVGPVLTVALLAAGAAGNDPPAPAQQAVALYDQGRYAEARDLLQKLDAQGALDGPLLYRLSFCLGVGEAADPAGQQAALERARAALEREAASDPTLESEFYLANALRNLNRRAEAREVALRAVARVESENFVPPADPGEAFRVAKLYADLGRQTEAMLWYRKALEGFEAAPDAAPVYIRWARRYAADVYFSRADFAAAEKEYAALVATGQAEEVDWDRLAVARVKLGEWAGAEQAWRGAEQANPIEADRARYARNLAVLAGKLGTLPAIAPDGRPWAELSQQDLESIMKTNGDRAKEIRGSAEAPDTSEEDRRKLAAELAALQPMFVAACIEYTVRGMPIRETAFFGGFAPLIFHADLWDLPQPASSAAQ
jgi:tetratricopeptide (TPR) repeat protein